MCPDRVFSLCIAILSCCHWGCRATGPVRVLWGLTSRTTHGGLHQKSKQTCDCCVLCVQMLDSLPIHFSGDTNFFGPKNESIKRDLKTRPINECRCDERLKTKDEESTRTSLTVCYTHNPVYSGHVAGNCRSGQMLKKPKYLSACDREERGRGEGAVCMCERVA